MAADEVVAHLPGAGPRGPAASRLADRTNFLRPPAVLFAPTPADYEPMTESPSDWDVPPPRPGTEVVLVVDDEPALRQVAQDALQEFGYTTLDAGSSDEAVRAFDAHPGRIHLLLADVRMPGGGGATLAAVLTARRPSLKVLLMSGIFNDLGLHRGIACPTVPFLAKPFSPDELARKVRQVLDGA